MLRSTVSFLILLMLMTPSSGQVRGETRFLEVERDGKFVKYRFIASATLNNAFPEWKASSSDRVQIAPSSGRLWRDVLRKAELISLSRYVDYKPPSVTPERGAGSAHSHPVFFPAAVVGDEIYVFSRLDIAGDAIVISQMMEKIGGEITSKDEARQLAEMYMLFYSGRFYAPSKLIISRVEDLPQDDRARRQEQVEKLAPLIHPLQVTDLKERYKVEFFTWEYLPRGEVINWQVSVFPNGKLEVSNSIIGMI
jgi:hypothetical protein